jgi:CsoR family transcriptional regulator, copper-sensing transcriptional repressor
MIDPYKKKALDRLKRARGQIDGIVKMIEDEKYCIDVLTQVLALQGAMKGLSSLVLESHLHTCGEKNLCSKDPKKKEKFISEILKASAFAGR